MIDLTELHRLSMSEPSDAISSHLLGRKPLPAAAEIRPGRLSGRRILVTGGCGSIGLALTRRVQLLGAEFVVAMDNSESAVAAAAKNPSNRTRIILADADGGEKFRGALKRFRIDSVIHAAANKHLPDLQRRPGAAIANNIINTWRCLQAAVDEGVNRFVLVSTDKACQPTSVLGASKRIAEECVAGFDLERTELQASSLRFGNILGSSGSVLRIFSDRMISGRTLPISDVDARRFFLTAEEASEFLIRVLLLPGNGRLFLANRRRSLRIADLAERLHFLLAGDASPDVDFTGLSEGEKIEEQLMSEGIATFEGEGLFSCEQRSPRTISELDAVLMRLETLACEYDAESTRSAIMSEVTDSLPKD